MADQWQEDIQQLLKATSIAFLASQAGRSPESSMVPYAIYQGNILVHLSGLAKHSKNILSNSKVGLMICTPENQNDSPLSLARISFQGNIKPVDSEDFEHAKAAYLKAIPDAAQLFSFSDFNLYHIAINNVYWVGGFGSARNVTLEAWHEITTKLTR